jgi:hypothetical protein
VNRIWTQAEADFILANAERLKDWELAQELSKLRGHEVTLASARQKRQRLRLKKLPGRGVCGLLIYKGEAEGLALILPS